MQLDLTKYPLGSRARVLAQLGGGNLNKALRTAKTGNISFISISSEIESAIERLFKANNIGTILTAYYEYGIVGSIPIEQLLQRMYELRDYPSYLKQAYRFGIYKGMEQQIEVCLKWHDERNLPDAYAWRVKYRKLAELDVVRSGSNVEKIELVDEEKSVKAEKCVHLELRPIKKDKVENLLTDISDSIDDPYIVSQISRNKLEKANQVHARTLRVLCGELEKRQFSVKETKLIDAFGASGGHKIIFEIKSVTESNEREQVRKAISQLYEYRFLYALQDALLCLVFSQEPFSKWLIDYLVVDRGICVLWVEDSNVVGPSLNQILGLQLAAG